MVAFLPKSDESYASAPWGWVVFLAALELLLTAFLGVIITLLKIQLASWISLVAAMTGSMVFAMIAEQRQPGVMTPAIKRQLTLRITAVMMVIGCSALALILGMSPAMRAALRIPLLVGIVVLSTLITWGVHRFGFNQGIKYARKARNTS